MHETELNKTGVPTMLILILFAVTTQIRFLIKRHADY